MVINGTKYSRMDQVKRLSSTSFNWSILEYFVPEVLQNSIFGPVFLTTFVITVIEKYFPLSVG